MSKTLLEEMLKKPQRETAGADTNLRFDYQKNWAFCEMIKRHLKGADYLVAFEYHDDVVFMEPDDDPQNVDFCQVKTKRSSSNVTLGFYLKRDKAKEGKKPSILGKMYENFDGIGAGHTVKTILVSNVPFSFCVSNSCAADLKENDVEKIKEKLTAELPDFDEDRLSNVHFLATGISLDAMQSFLMGEVSELFKKELGEGHGVNMHAWTRLVQDEINRKNNIDSETISSTSDLKLKKCVDRKFLTGTIQLVANNKTRAPDMALVNAELKDAGWSAIDLMKLGKKISNAVSDYTNPTNGDAQQLRQRLEHLFHSAVPETLPGFLTSALSQVETITDGLSLYSEKFYFLAFAVIVFNEEI
ncbi:dsDNA nuclease domain-containing protein [Marinovum sp. SP66]|uniref:dsDNA nuclease domain-containing protein n=1 Tax=Marinovum TaxID=367771 RepID=UPI00237C16F7|nr:dsDNA nuclease domain-containing protein [Marinovum sp. SP66]MDD9741851.1 dsDNA nuclease domain-containing protein [Marinovum sp. SP66]